MTRVLKRRIQLPLQSSAVYLAAFWFDVVLRSHSFMRRKMNLHPAKYKLEFANVAFGFSEYRRNVRAGQRRPPWGHLQPRRGSARFSLIPTRPLGNRNFAQCAEIGFKLSASVWKSIRLQDKGDDVDVRVIAEAVRGSAAASSN